MSTKQILHQASECWRHNTEWQPLTRQTQYMLSQVRDFRSIDSRCRRSETVAAWLLGEAHLQVNLHGVCLCMLTAFLNNSLFHAGVQC